MRLKSIALLALTLQFPIALANPSELSSADFRPDSWSKGLHLTAAIGLSESVFFESKSPREHLGEGAVLTDGDLS